MNQVGLFFFVGGKFLFHGCSFENAENYGDFLIYPNGHYDVWEDKYFNKYKVDYDYYPRGRVVYRKSDKRFIVYYDKCIEMQIFELLDNYEDYDVELSYDEHYKCFECNEGYVI